LSTHEDAENRLVRLQRRPQIDRECSAACIADEDQTPLASECCRLTLQCRPNRVDDKIDTVTSRQLHDCLDDISRVMINRMIQSKPDKPFRTLTA
jgi:hypothetical protein